MVVAGEKGVGEEIKPFSENKRVTKQRYDVKRLLRMSRSLRAPTQEHPRFNGNPCLHLLIRLM